MTEYKITDWSSDLASLMRLDNALRGCNIYASMDEYKPYMKECINAWKEIKVKCNKDELTEGNKARKEIREFYNKIANSNYKGKPNKILLS